jgi:hypothetical protein
MHSRGRNTQPIDENLPRVQITEYRSQKAIGREKKENQLIALGTDKSRCWEEIEIICVSLLRGTRLA